MSTLAAPPQAHALLQPLKVQLIVVDVAAVAKMPLSELFIRVPRFPLQTIQVLNQISDPVKFRVELHRLTRDPRFIEALQSTHSELLQEILSTEADDFGPYEKVVLKYIFRMSHRCTPVGAMAGIGHLSSGNGDVFRQKSLSFELVHYSNSVFLRNLYERNLPELLDKLMIQTNPTATVKGNQVWIVDAKDLESRRGYFSTYFTAGDEILSLLEACRTPRSFSSLVKEFRLKKSELPEFRASLISFIKDHVLEVDFYPSRIGDETEVHAGKPTEARDKVRRNIAVNTDARLIIPENRFPESAITEIHSSLLKLQGLRFVKADGAQRFLKNCEEAIFRNYPERAIPFNDFIHFISVKHLKHGAPVTYSYLPVWRKFVEQFPVDTHSIELTEDLIADLRKHETDQLEPFTATISLARENDENLKAQLVFAINGWAGKRMYSRYLHMFPELKVSTVHEAPVIYADMDYYSSDLANNFLKRPLFTKYVIRLNHHQKIPDAEYIELSDLLISYRSGSFQLYSEKLKKQVVPIWTTSYNAIDDTHPFLHFLCQAFHPEPSAIHQIFFTPERTYQPRVTYKGLVLSLRRWLLEKNDFLKKFMDKDYRSRLKLPRLVMLVHEDLKIPLDLDSEITTRLIVSKAKNPMLYFEEEWHQAYGKNIETPDGDFTHELMFPVIPENPTLKRTLPVPATRPNLLPQNGVEQINIALPFDLMDNFLIHVLFPYLKKMKAKKLFTAFYFVKYPAPFPHIRLRLFHPAKKLAATEIMKHLERVKDDYLIAHTALVPFEAETDTYGGAKGMSLYHKLSCAISEAYPIYLPLRDEIGAELHPMMGKDVDVLFLHLYLRRLLKEDIFQNLTIESVRVDITAGASDMGRYKNQLAKLWKKHRKSLREPQKSWPELWSTVDKVIDKQRPSLKLMQKEMAKKNSTLKKEFFFQRLVHMEIFRLSNGDFPFAEPAAYELLQLWETETHHLKDTRKK